MSLRRNISAGLTLALLMSGPAVQAGNDRYGASLVASAWAVQSADKGQCTLSHSIPQLGDARFTQVAGKPLAFRLVIPQESQFAKQVSWRGVPLPWKHDITPMELGRQTLTEKSKYLVLSSADTQRLFHELERGLSVDFVFEDGVQGKTPITVNLSAVRFTGQTHAFETCVAGLIKLAAASGKPEAGKVTAEFPVPFSANSYELEAPARQILGDMARDYRIGKSHSRILIAGHTDAQESPASTAYLALRRAREIKGYLVRRGLPAERIEIRQAGKRVTVTGAAGEGELARATIWLVN